jgi:hypothetical protein
MLIIKVKNNNYRKERTKLKTNCAKDKKKIQSCNSEKSYIALLPSPIFG